jgi:lysophospholipase L1-like esterase
MEELQYSCGVERSACPDEKIIIMDILFIGHSLIEFFDWQGRFPDHRVANLGVAGESVEGLLSRTDVITAKHSSADCIFIMTGLNNIAMEDFSFLASYREIIEKLSAAYPSALIYVHSIFPVIFEFISNESIREINSSLKDVSADMGVQYLDFYGLFIDETGHPLRELLLDDGVHLSNKGYAVWSDRLERLINK